MMRSLRTKGVIGFVAMVAYVTVVAGLIAQQRTTLLSAVQTLERVYGVEEALTKVNTSVAHAILHVNDAYSSRETTIAVETIELDIEAIQSGLSNLTSDFPAARRMSEALTRDIAELRAVPLRGNLVPLRGSVHLLVAELDEVARQVSERKKRLGDTYRSAYDAINAIALIMGGIGIVVFGLGVTWFLTRMTRDLAVLKRRALDVVAGYRGEPLQVTRADEIGDLMDSVNRMQSDLRDRERHIEMARQQRFHQEKMAAVGSLAAAVAHEINNPIAAIQGIAERLEMHWPADAQPTEDLCRPRTIIEQTRRISAITRQLGEMTAQQAADPRLVDLNTLVRNTSNFVSYDPRFRDVDIDLRLDGQIPAVHAVADHLMQVLMNLLINAADALAACDDLRRTITVTTECTADQVHLEVADNGQGMDPETVRRAFDEFFTTKPVGRGTGIGLFMCRTLVGQAGGGITLTSRAGAGTWVNLWLPIPGDRDPSATGGRRDDHR